MEEASHEFWWFVDSCSPPRAGGEHVVLQQKLELEVLEQRDGLRSRDIQELVDRSYILQGWALLDTVSTPCVLS